MELYVYCRYTPSWRGQGQRYLPYFVGFGVELAIDNNITEDLDFQTWHWVCLFYVRACASADGSCEWSGLFTQLKMADLVRPVSTTAFALTLPETAIWVYVCPT